MFIIEKMVDDHQRRVEAWERSRQKWIDTHEYYSRGDYEERYPRPGHTLKVVANGIFIGLMVAAVVGTVIFVATKSSSHKTHHNTAVVQKKDDKTYVFKVDDKVQVVYGDYANSVGVIVKVTKDSAIIKLTSSSLTHAMCNASSSCSNGGGKDNGELLSVGSLDNLVPYKEVKE